MRARARSCSPGSPRTRSGLARAVSFARARPAPAAGRAMLSELCLVRRARDSLDEGGRSSPHNRGRYLAEDGLNRAGLFALLVDGDLDRWQWLFRPRRHLTERAEGHPLETILQRRPAHASINEDAADHGRCNASRDCDDLAHPHRVGCSPLLEHGQVLVHPLACFLYLPLDFTRRSAHSLFSFKVSRVRLGRRSWNRDRATMSRASPMRMYAPAHTSAACQRHGTSSTTNVGTATRSPRRSSRPPPTARPTVIAYAIPSSFSPCFAKSTSRLTS